MKRRKDTQHNLGQQEDTYINMSRFFVNKESSSIPLSVFASLDGTILAVDIVTWESDNPGDWVVHQNEKGETILSLSVDLKQRIQTTWWLSC